MHNIMARMLAMIVCMEWIDPTVSFTTSTFALYIHSQRYYIVRHSNIFHVRYCERRTAWITLHGTAQYRP